MAPPLRRSMAMGSLALRYAAYLRRPRPPLPLQTLAPPTPIRRPLPDLSPCRHLAAPPQVNRKSKEDENDDSVGPRINNAITSPFVRLVNDQGHSVVPRHEALQLAARMEMDLVEVHRKSEPPVCKIMDFHKEKYKKEVKEKERLKTKSAIILRGGDNKEVRFKGKTELKDLMVKADAITRLMERGYRVKCMAMPSGNEGEDLGGPLSRLLGLIQDVCIVESGPHLDSKHAYVIVRHVKFATKKGGKKASKAMEDAGKGTRGTPSESQVAGNDNEDETTECGSEADDRAISDHVDKTAAYLSSESSTQKEGQDRGLKRELNRSKSNRGADHGKMPNNNAGGSRINPGQWGPQTSERRLGSKDAKPDMEKRENNNQDKEPGEINRYAARRQPIRGGNQGLRQGRSQQDRRNENEGQYAVNDHQIPLEQHNQSLPRFNQDRLPQDPRNERRGHFPSNNNQKQAAGDDLGNPNPKTKSFGIFSTLKPASSEVRKTNGACTSKPNPDLPKSYGIFGSSRRESDNKS
ncbi:translation initiation factor IF3-1, mitochondrial-like [Phragmites australis]|uniref:translation initiation factor IF3-1, mitochondrial-like n=1 Tax=Phragmites australis TaxID=29695 RepID=UPI002D78EE63|nr:translation initiation factor IF3-1, mitochondrial-like [Phragmites australis]